MKNNIYMLMTLIFSCLTLTSCWNYQEINDLAIVLGIGVDKTDKGNEYKVTFQVVNPSEASSGQGRTPSGQALAVINYTSTGKTLVEASRRTSRKVSRKNFYPHISVLVVGEALAKTGIEGMLDVFERDSQVQPGIPIIIARGTTAEAALSVLTPLENIPANSINKKLKNTQDLFSENEFITVHEVISALASGGSEPIISGVRVYGSSKAGANKSNLGNIHPQTTADISGIAVFKDGKLIRWLDDGAARGAMYLLNKVKATNITLSCADKQNFISVQDIQSNTSIKGNVHTGKPVIYVTINVEGFINDVSCGLDLSDPKTIAALNKQTSSVVKKDISAALKVAYEAKSDIFGFSEVLYRSDPVNWNEIKKSWDEMFTQTRVELKVVTSIRHTGARSNPFTEKKSK